VLLVNLGSPAAPTPAAVRSYLAEFLSDPRVVALPRALWLPILHGLVLRSRPARSARKYAAIWTAEGSPLTVHTARQAALLAAALPGWRVQHAMRYGGPSIAQGLAALADCERIVALPLYPQYSGSATGSVLDALHKTALGAPRAVIEDFHAHPAYIGALAQSVRARWASAGEPEMLVMSFHGLPRRSIERGDPYHRQCLESGELLAAALGLAPDRYRIAFQSRFGFAAWIEPYTATVLCELGAARTRRVDVLCPGFVADCLETLEEIGIEGRRIFRDAGGGEFNALPCLNELPDWIAALAQLAREAAGKP
jgi:ferrochelatase